MLGLFLTSFYRLFSYLYRYKIAPFFFAKRFLVFIGYVQIFEVNKLTNRRQNFGSTADLAKKLMYAISACSA